MIVCDHCKKQFTSIYTLKQHQKTAKYCLDLQKNLNSDSESETEHNKDYNKIIKCEFCNKKTTTQSNLKIHYLSCKVKKEQKYKEELSKIEQKCEEELTKKDQELNKVEHRYKEELTKKDQELNKVEYRYKEELTKKDQELTKVEQNYKQELSKVEQKYREELIKVEQSKPLYELEITKLEELVNKLEQENNEYRKALLTNNEKITQEVLKRPTVVHNTQQHINNYHAEYNRMFSELVPYSDTYLKNKIKQITPDQLIYVHNLDNANSNNLIDYNFACNLVNILKSNVFFTDSSRGKLVYKDEENNNKKEMVEKFVLECVKACKDECVQLCKTCIEIVRSRENEFTYEDYGKCITGLAQLSDCIRAGKPHAIITEIANKLVKHSSCLPSIKEFKHMLEQSTKKIEQT